MAGKKQETGFRVGEIVRAEGKLPPGDGFAMIEGEVRPNYEGGYYCDSPNVVLVRGVITSLEPLGPLCRQKLEDRGVYFHVKDVTAVAPSKGHPVPEQSIELAQIADALEGAAEILSHPEQLHSAQVCGGMIGQQTDRVRKLANGN